MSKRAWAGVGLVAVLVLLVGGYRLLRNRIEGADDWLVARLDGDRLVLEIGGQCGPDSYLRHLRIAGSENPAQQVWWEIQAGPALRATPSVTVGVLPSGFIEENPFHELAGSLSVVLKTNFNYEATVDLATLADGDSQRYEPQPVWSEGSPVHPANC